MKVMKNAMSVSPGLVSAANSALPFEYAMSLNPRWAMSEGSLFFDGQGRVQTTLIRIVRRLDELGIPYAVAGGMALFAHGYRRFTDDIDIVMTRPNLDRMHEELDGRGWIRPFSNSKNLRDAQTGVRIEFLITGGFPGDGKPKPVAFPDPIQSSIEIGGIRYLNLSKFVELKLASGISGQNREKDLIDVGELIRAATLPQHLADDLDPSVREQYLRIWRKVNDQLVRFVLDRIVAGDRITDMLNDGVVLEGDISDPNARLVTTDPAIAKKYGMDDERESL